MGDWKSTGYRKYLLQYHVILVCKCSEAEVLVTMGTDI